jgi:hypothetical protein
MNIHRETFQLEIPDSTAVGTYSGKIDLRTDFARCLRVAMYEVSDGGISYYRLGIKYNVGSVIQKLTHKRDWITKEGDTNRKMDDNYKPFEFDASQGINYEIQITEPLTTSIIIDMVFELC